jgi:hypothetical protein
LVGHLRFQKLRQDRHGDFEGQGALFGQLADRLRFQTCQLPLLAAIFQFGISLGAILPT